MFDTLYPEAFSEEYAEYEEICRILAQEDESNTLLEE
jgi:hypothetical protein